VKKQKAKRRSAGIIERSEYRKTPGADVSGLFVFTFFKSFCYFIL